MHSTLRDSKTGNQIRIHSPQKKNEPCPLKGVVPDDWDEAGSTCCEVRSNRVVDALDHLGEYELTQVLCFDAEPARALELADALNEAADRLEAAHRGRKHQPKGHSGYHTWDPAAGQYVPIPQSAFEESIAAIRHGARWFKKVGELDFGVHVHM